MNKPISAVVGDEPQVELPPMDEEYGNLRKLWLGAHRGTLSGWNNLPISVDKEFRLDCRERQLEAALRREKTQTHNLNALNNEIIRLESALAAANQRADEAFNAGIEDAWRVAVESGLGCEVIWPIRALKRPTPSPTTGGTE